MTNKSENPREKLYRKTLHSHWVKIVSALASVVVFCTVYALILPAITMSNQDPKCGIEEHTHIAECYDAEGNIICGLEEHAHSLSCYSDLYAAIEDEGYWSADIPELTGDRNADVLAVAQSQIGYRENDENYLISENEQTKGYTRYGHWYGEFVDTESERLENGLSYYAYKDWDAMFASFVLYNANIYDMGLDSDAGNWAGALVDAGIYVDAADYVPQIGDLIFYTRNAGENMHVGIVSGVNRGFFGNEIKSISVIAGDSNNEVEEIKVAVAEYTEGDITFETIHGYGVLTPGYGVTDESTASEVQPDDSTVAEVAAEEIAGEDVAVEPAVEEAADASEAEEVVNLDNSADHLIGQNEESLDTVEENTEGSALVEIVDGAVSEDGSEIVMNWSLSANLPDATLPAGAIIRVDTASAKVHSMTVEQARAWAETAGTGAEYATFVDNDNYEVTFIGGNGLLYSWADVQNMDAAAATSFTGVHIKVLNDVELGEDGAVFFDFATTARVADANVGQNYYVSKVNVNGFAGAATFTYENGEAEAVDQNAVLRDAGLDEEPAQKTLVSKKSDYTVTMSYGPEAEIPDGSKLYVKEIKQGTEEYNQYIEDAKAALGISEEDAKELLGRFFDIKIITRDGIFEPKAAVNVNIEYQTAIETEDASAVSAVHFSEDGPEAIEVEAVDVAEPEDEVAMVKSVEFTAESFSVYGIVYTVDFEYVDPGTGEVYSYSLKGGESINLTDLLVTLGLKNREDAENFVANDVENVEFSDPELVKVTHKGKVLGIFGAEDWLLESLKPFYSTETLTISQKDGSELVIIVRDLQYTTSLNDVLSDMTISGAEWDPATNSYIVKKGKQYGITMNFQEGEGNGQYQFANDGTMTLQLPSGVRFEADGTFNIYVNEAGENYTIDGNQVKINQTTGNLEITFNTGHQFYQKLKDLTTARFTISATGVFTNQSDEYTIDGQTDTHIKVDNTPDVNITKAGSIIDWNSDPNNATVKYTLNVTSNGEASGVEITDTISGTGLTYNGDAKVYLNGTEITNDWERQPRNNGFYMKTGALEDGKTYVVEYTANLAKGALTDNGDGSYSLGANNKVEWTGDKEYEHPLEHIVDRPGISKSGSTKEQNGSVTTTTWKIEADSDWGTNNRLTEIIDRIKTPGVQYVEGQGKGIHVVVKDRITGETVAEDTIEWTSGILASDKQSWTYNVNNITDSNGQPLDNTGKKYHYTITYDTVYDIGNATQGVTITNEYEDNRDNEGEGQAYVGPNPENKFDLDKQFLSKENVLGDTIVTWTIKVTVPASGLSASDAVLTDVLPSTGDYQDTFESYVDCTNLYDGETVDYDYQSEPGKVIFTFKNEGNPGLKQSNNGKARELLLTLKTKCDAAWLAVENAELTHTNEAIFHNIHKTAHYVPDKPSMVKNGRRDGESEGLPKFSFDLIAGVFSDDLFTHPYADTTVGTDTEKGPYVEIVDKYDPRFIYIADSATVKGGDQDSQENGGTSDGVDAFVNADAHKITFRLYKNSLPKNGTSLYQYYKVNYSLRIKDAQTLATLRDEAIAQGKAVKLGNSVTGFGGNSITVDYEPKILEKGHEKEGDKLKFTIKVNEEGLKLTDNGVLVLTDTMKNLSVRYQDVTVEVAGNKTVETQDAQGNPVTAPYFNMKGNVLTFYIPDEAPVTITYYATPRGEVDSNNNIHYSNTAKVLGFEKTDSGDEQYTSDAVGYGTNYGVYIYKADGNVNSNALAGAVFKLYEVDQEDANGNIISGTPIKDKDGNDYTVTTADGTHNTTKGVVMVIGTDDLGFNLKPEKHYYLLETKAPEGYALDNTKYSFTISKDGYVNYTNKPVYAPDGSGKLIQAWTYHNGDVLTMKNWRKDGVLTLEKSFIGIDPATMNDDQKAAIKFDIYTITGEEGDETQTLWRTITYDQFSAEENEDHTISYRYTIGDLPAGKYRVVETVDDVTCRVTTYAVVDPDNGAGANNESDNKNERYATIIISDEDVRDHTENQVTVSNEYNIPSEFKIYKHAEGETSYKIAGAEFGVYELNDNYEIKGTPIAHYTTNARGRFTITQTNDDGQGVLQTNTVYGLKEINAPTGFLENEQVFYFCFLADGTTNLPANPPSGTKAIEWLHSENQNIGDTPDTTYLEATKVYKNGLLDDDTEKHDPIQIRVKQIASYDKAGKVIEPVLSGYYKTGSDKPVKIAQQATVFDVIYDTGTSEWHIADGVQVVNGKLTGLPTMTFDNHIPIYYTYEVEELPIEGYKASYEIKKKDDGGTSATVINKPNTVAATTRVKAKKKWVDVDGNDVTSKMGVDESISVDVYRYPGILSRGTVYEADGSVRDAGQLYYITLEDGRNAAEIKSIQCLPGDRIQYRVKVFAFQNNKTIENFPVKVRCNNDAALGTVSKTIDVENNEVIFEFIAPTSTQDRDIRIEIQEVSSYELSSTNLSAAGRTQVLTQADLEGIENKQKLETLKLNGSNGWSDTSKEYITKARMEVDHGGWTQWEDVTFSYFIVEPSGSTYEAEYQIQGDTITAVNIDKKLEVDKKWLAANGDEITDKKDSGSITYTIKKNTYHIDPPAIATIDHSNLQAGGKFVREDSIASGIKVGSTIKVTVYINDRAATPEDSSLEGLEFTGVTELSHTAAYRVNKQNINQYDWMIDYFFKVDQPVVTLYGNLITLPDYGEQTFLKVSIQKEPEAVVEPPEGASPVGDADLVGTVTVGYDNVLSYQLEDGYSDATVTDGEKFWSAIISKLPAVDGNGNIFTYTVTEAVAEDFEQVVVDDQGNITVVQEGESSAPLGGTATLYNRLKPGYLEVKKVVEGADPHISYQIAVTDSDGNYYDRYGGNHGSTPHYETFSAGQPITWNPLTPGTYTISEKDASQTGYSWTVSGTGSVNVELGETTKATVKNSYFKTTKYIPKATKALKIGDDDVDPWPAGVSFDFYLNFVSAVDSDGQTPLSRTDITMESREAEATESHKTGQFGEIEFKKPGTYTFTIEEVEPAGTQDHERNNITYSQDKVTLTVVIKEKAGSAGELEVDSATYRLNDQVNNESAVITNTMSYPDYSPSVTKSLKENGVEVADVDWGNRTFIFDLTIDNNDSFTVANAIMPSGEAAEATVDKDTPDHKKAFGKIHFKAAGTYKFLITERDLSSSDSQVGYDTTAKPVEVTVQDVGDGNLAVTKVKVDGTEVTGDAIVGSGVTVTNTYTREKEYKFKKVWLDDNSASANSVQWVKDIKVDLYGRKSGASDTHIGEYTIQYPAPDGAAYSVALKEEYFGGKHYYSYEVTIPHLDAQYDSFYVVEQRVDGYATDYGQLHVDDPTETTNSIDIVAEKTSADDGEYVINSLIHITLPSTGGFGTTPFCYMGIVLIALASVLFAYINRSKLSMICMENSVGSGGKTNKRRGGGGL